MEQSGGAAKHAKPSSDAGAGAGADDSVDRISELPDDVLVLILTRVRTRAAARTSVLSRRWRRLWKLLPELSFLGALEADRARAVLEGHDAPLRGLLILSRFAAADSVAALLRSAARRVTGQFFFMSEPRGSENEDAEGGAFVLPCFESATRIFLQLGFLGLAAPAAGVFARLTDLCLCNVQFQGPLAIGDSSSPRFPCLQTLTIHDARGMESLTVRSECLLEIELSRLSGLRHLTIVAPALKQLRVGQCSSPHLPAANISAPQLKLLEINLLNPCSVHLGNMEHEHLQRLGTLIFIVYADGEDSRYNHACQSILRRFKAVEDLSLSLFYHDDIDGYQYMMDDMTMFPEITFLHLTIIASGHAFGASLFHVLRMCSGIRRLNLELVIPTKHGDYICPSGCICGQQPNWEDEALLLNHLQEVEITRFRGSEHELPFVQQLFNWATALKRISIIFDYLVTESMAKELYQMVQSCSRPEICMEFYWYLGRNKVLYAPKD
ncbi:hypothetical protein ACP4OV_030700 [Aristida adscensionis]